MSDINKISVLKTFIEHQKLTLPELSNLLNTTTGNTREEELNRVLQRLENDELIKRHKLIDPPSWQICNEGLEEYNTLALQSELKIKKEDFKYQVIDGVVMKPGTRVYCELYNDNGIIMEGSKVIDDDGEYWEYKVKFKDDIITLLNYLLVPCLKEKGIDEAIEKTSCMIFELNEMLSAQTDMDEEEAIEEIGSIIYGFTDIVSIKLMTQCNAMEIPPYIYSLIYDLSKFVNPKTHLDPFLTISSPCNFLKFGMSKAFCINKLEFEFIKIWLNDENNEIVFGDGLKELDAIKTKFDFITCFPPFDLKKEPTEINGFKASDDLACQLLIKSGLLLNNNGKAIFLMSSSFLENKATKEIINKSGLFIDAVFEIPSGEFSPQTDIASNLVIITKQPKKKTFVAEISNDEIRNKLILENYKERKEGKSSSIRCAC
jgi:hypothetical protein